MDAVGNTPRKLPPQDEVIEAVARTARLCFGHDKLLRVSAVQRHGTQFYRVTLVSPVRRVRAYVDGAFAHVDVKRPEDASSTRHEGASKILADAFDLVVGLPN